MRLALSSTEATLGTSGYYAVVHIDGFHRLLEDAAARQYQTRNTGQRFFRAAERHPEHVRRSFIARSVRRWGTTFGTTAVKRRPSAKLLKPTPSLLPRNWMRW